MAKEDSKDQPKQSLEQDLYAEYVKGANPQSLADKHGIEPGEVLAIIQAVQTSNSKG